MFNKTCVLIVLEAETLVGSVFTDASQEAAARREPGCIIIASGLPVGPLGGGWEWMFG